MAFSFQLYSARNFTPWEDVLQILADIGYSQIEGFAPNYEDAAAFRQAMDKHGLTMPSGHFDIHALEDDLATCAATAQTLGVETIVCPYLAEDERPTDLASWLAFADRLRVLGHRVRDVGFAFAWHNHDFEFKACGPENTLPMELLMESVPELLWELDVAWVVRAGCDPLPWIERFGDRIPIVHAKDIADSGECADEDGWADFGHGVIDWDTIYKALNSASPHSFVAEHDNPSDLKRFATRAFQSFKQLTEGGDS